MACIVTVFVLMVLAGCSYAIQSNPGFDHFVFAQQWPPGACKTKILEVNGGECVIPKNVTTWTIHGLWPSLKSSEKPDNCNNSWEFDPNKIVSIEDQLLMRWPNLINSTHRYTFWSHEWTKHGTCAAKQEDLNSELKYFSKGLDLQQSLDIAKALEVKGIVPNDNKTYLVDDFKSALFSFFANRSIVIECSYVKETQFIKAVEVCISRHTYKAIPCPTNSNNLLFKPMDKFSSLKSLNQNNDQANLGKCKGSPVYCECTDSLVYPKYHKEVPYVIREV